MVDSLTAKEVPFVHFDLGNFAANEDAVAEYKTRFIWDMMAQMHVDATTPGSRELNLWTTFSELMAGGQVPVVSSNLRLLEAGVDRPVGETWRLIEKNGVKLGVFALIGGDEYAGARPPDGVEFKFLDPFQTAAELVPEIAKQVDLVVLLSEMSGQDTDRLVQTVPGIDLALYGNRAAWIEDAAKQGETITQQTGLRGQYIGELVLILNPAGEVIDFASKNAPLDKAYPEAEAVKKAITEADDHVKLIQTESRKKQQSQFEQKLSGERYLGADNCKRCHPAQYEQWQSSPHAHAFATLEKTQKDKDVACVKCHVTGFAEQSGYSVTAASSSPHMENVQCEVCHGHGTEHDRSRRQAVAEATCRSCHVGEYERGFDFASAVALVKH